MCLFHQETLCDCDAQCDSNVSNVNIDQSLVNKLINIMVNFVKMKPMLNEHNIARVVNESLGTNCSDNDIGETYVDDISEDSEWSNVRANDDPKGKKGNKSRKKR